MRKISAAFVFALALSLAARAASDGHEYAPIQEKKIKYKDWTFKRMSDGTPLNLREWARGKRLVLVVYFAPWCANWKNEAPLLTTLYEKYRRHGLDIVAVSNYGTPDEQRAYFKDKRVPYEVVVESDKHEARQRTTHYDYRRRTGDARKWGSPYNVFLTPAELKDKGDTLTEKAWIANGELVEQEAEAFVRQRLGLNEAKETKAVTLP